MGNFLKWSGRRLSTGWFWPLALLAFPNCILPAYHSRPDIFDPGPAPQTGAIMCEIPRVPEPGSSPCATPEEAEQGMAMGHAAVALNAGDANPLVLDYSPEALAECSGLPKKAAYFGPFPDGLTVCLNCETQITEKYADANAACVAKCQDLVEVEGPEPAEGALAYCQQHAKVSVNFNPKACFEGFCSYGGTPIGLPDPRRNPEDLKWIDWQNTNLEDNGFTLKFYGPETGDFNGGAASDQLITEGDAWVEFEAGETGVSHAIGVRTSCDDVSLCPDDIGTLADMPLVLSLNSTGEVNVVENGLVVAGPYSPYNQNPNQNERFRIYVTDHHDGTADISFSRLTDTCTPGTFCNETVFYLHPAGTGPTYPLRIDASFREANASLKNVTIMRIIKK